MNILFCTQSEGLELFDSLHRSMRNRGVLTRAGFVVADSWTYTKWLTNNPDFEKQDHVLLKEWEITGKPFTLPDRQLLASYERYFKSPAGLFGALVADRRLFMGRDCTYSQDYRRRYTDEELLSILQRGLGRMEEVFDNLKPDAVIGFICVTMLDYLAYLFAKARGVRFLNIRPTRVADRITLGSTLNDPSPEFAATYSRSPLSIGDETLNEARRYLDRVRRQHGKYEGVVPPSDKPVLKANVKRWTRLQALRQSLANYLQYRRSIAARDNHVPDPLRALYFAAIANPSRAREVNRKLSDQYVRAPQLANMRYVFFPLHTEPEVSLLVYGRPYVNQIEVIRWLAISLPIDHVLVVKEHPWMVGKRSSSAYSKLLNIPRVQLADPKLEARTLIQHSMAVAVITGSVALEAAILGKPVLTFGDCPYNLLPRTMVRRCDDPRHLPMILGDLLANYLLDDDALVRYLAAVMDTSVGLNLYSILLRKRSVYTERAGEYAVEVERLAEHVVASLRASPVMPDAAAGAALW